MFLLIIIIIIFFYLSLRKRHENTSLSSSCVSMFLSSINLFRREIKKKGDSNNTRIFVYDNVPIFFSGTPKDDKNVFLSIGTKYICWCSIILLNIIYYRKKRLCDAYRRLYTRPKEWWDGACAVFLLRVECNLYTPNTYKEKRKKKTLKIHRFLTSSVLPFFSFTVLVYNNFSLYLWIVSIPRSKREIERNSDRHF